ncbi:valine--tRNA ligase, putative [Plasmodium ovale wallikeri]|uniref:valine--tRNA ligase n=1 Tax=Plasmodium ovale wallikeri TaxID=864142 RepID=A0A1A8YS84_PLAOA|nr:valine--tRNA ligase, putative [Plasmodium ovale wallikeri]
MGLPSVRLEGCNRSLHFSLKLQRGRCFLPCCFDRIPSRRETMRRLPQLVFTLYLCANAILSVAHSIRLENKEKLACPYARKKESTSRDNLTIHALKRRRKPYIIYHPVNPRGYRKNVKKKKKRKSFPLLISADVANRASHVGIKRCIAYVRWTYRKGINTLSFNEKHVQEERGKTILLEKCIPRGYSKMSRRLHEIIYRKNYPLGILSWRYSFFKIDTLPHLNCEIINEICTRYITNSVNFYIDIFTELYKISQYENVYDKAVTNFLYLFKKQEEKKYVQNFHSSHYGNAFILVYPPPNLSGELHAGHYFNFIHQHILLLFNKHILARTDHGGLSAHEMFYKDYAGKSPSKRSSTGGSGESIVGCVTTECDVADYAADDHAADDRAADDHAADDHAADDHAADQRDMSKWQESLREKILEDMQRMNIVVDRERFYNTMDSGMKDIVTKTFHVLFKNDIILNKFYPAYYCYELKTVIPRHDVEFREERTDKCLLRLHIVSQNSVRELTERTSEHEVPHPVSFLTEGQHKNGKEIQKISSQVDGSNCCFKEKDKYEDLLRGSHSNEVKLFRKRSCHFEYINDDRTDIKSMDYIFLELESPEQMQDIAAVLYYSPRREKYQKKFALLPFSNRAIPLVFCKWRTMRLSLLCSDGFGDHAQKDQKDQKGQKGQKGQKNQKQNSEDVFMPVFFSKWGDGHHKENPILPCLSNEMDKTGYIKVQKAKDNIFKCAYYKNHRCKLVLSEQWGLKYDKLSKSFYETKDNKDIKIIPSKFKKYFLQNSVENDLWILSRQIPFGHPIPLYKYDPGEIIPSEKVSSGEALLKNFSCYVYGNSVEEAQENLIKSAYFERRNIKKEFLQREDVLDSWFSSCLYFLHCLRESGVDVSLLLRERKGCLVDFLCTGKDILYPWVLRSFSLLYYLAEGGHLEEILRRGSDSEGDISDPKSRRGKEEHGGGEAERGGGEAERGGGEAERGGGEAQHCGGEAQHSGGEAQHCGGEAERGVKPKLNFRLASTVKFHGILRDNVGRKISKSDINATHYKRLLEKVNTDSMRLSLAFLEKGKEDVVFSQNYVHKSNKFLRKLWNIGTYIKKNCPFEPYQMFSAYFRNRKEYIYEFLKKYVDSSNEVEVLDVSLTPRMAHVGIFSLYCETINKVMNEIISFNTSKIIQTIYDFIMKVFSRFYMVYCLHENNNGKINNIGAFLIRYIFEGMLKALFPFIPHITEVLYIQLYLKKKKKKKYIYISQYILSCNYDFFKHEQFVLKDSVQTNKYFFTLMDIFFFLRKSKKISSNMHILLRIYLKRFMGDPPLTLFQNEKTFFCNSCGVNVSFYVQPEGLPIDTEMEIHNMANEREKVLHKGQLFIILS